MQELCYPFDEKLVLRKRRYLRNCLLSEHDTFTPLRIAVLGSSSTELLEDLLEIFLLNEGIMPTFYSGTFGKYYEEVVFDNPELDLFHPEVIYFHTGAVTIQNWPNCTMTEQEVDTMLQTQMDHFRKLWTYAGKFKCLILQNNFELPHLRLLGNMDGTSYYGRTRYIQKLNQLFLECSHAYENVCIHDICYLSADYGLQHWYNPAQWYHAKMCPGLEASVYLAYSLARTIASQLLGNKKMIVTDLDDTLWGGTVAEVGIEGINMAPEDSMGEAHLDFQQWLLEMKRVGIILGISSKNDETDALSGLTASECRLRPEDFAFICANWEPKDENIQKICDEIRISPDATVFIDDNESERHLVRSKIPGIQVPTFSRIEELLPVLSRALYFNIATVTKEDLLRANSYRSLHCIQTQNYEQYLQELDMCMEIHEIRGAGTDRMLQLLNKTNRFNVNGKRYTRADIGQMLEMPEDYILIGGHLKDLVADHGMISYMLCRLVEQGVELLQWVTSCRVFQRGVEHSMMDYLVSLCRQQNRKHIFCTYIQTEKNHMVKELLQVYGFREIVAEGTLSWRYVLSLEDYRAQPHYIRIV